MPSEAPRVAAKVTPRLQVNLRGVLR